MSINGPSWSVARDLGQNWKVGLLQVGEPK